MVQINVVWRETPTYPWSFHHEEAVARRWEIIERLAVLQDKECERH